LPAPWRPAGAQEQGGRGRRKGAEAGLETLDHRFLHRKEWTAWNGLLQEQLSNDRSVLDDTTQ
jgi:hypothetical protein